MVCNRSRYRDLIKEKSQILLTEVLPDQDPARVYVLKTHKRLEPEMPGHICFDGTGRP